MYILPNYIIASKAERLLNLFNSIWNDEDSANMGIGLTVVNDLVQIASGTTTIASGDAILRIEGSESNERNIMPWQGVIISLELKREMVNNVKIHEVIRKYQPSVAGPSLTFE